MEDEQSVEAAELVPVEADHGTPAPVMPEGAVSTLSRDDIDELNELVQESDAKNTIETYASQWGMFESWCHERGHCPLPANPDTVAAFLKSRADDGRAISTLSAGLSAIKRKHRDAGYPFDSDHQGLKRALKTLRKRISMKRSARQAKAIRATELLEVLSELTGSLRDRRDAAMLRLGYIFALRRSELAGLDWQTLGDGGGVLKVSGDDAELTLMTSKTSQDSAQKLVTSRRDNKRAFAEIERWIEVAGIGEGTAIMRSITPMHTASSRRLSNAGVNDALRAVMYRHFLREGATPTSAKKRAAEFSGHSMRVGFIVAAKESGADSVDVSLTSRHKNLEMIAHYSKEADQKRRSAHRIPGVGLNDGGVAEAKVIEADPVAMADCINRADDAFRAAFFQALKQ